MNPRFLLYFIIALILVAVFIDIPKLPFNPQLPAVNAPLNQFIGYFPTKLGLDLKGGVQLVLETQMDKIGSDERDTALESAREVIEKRVNLFGVSESVVQTSKIGDKRRILVEIPGFQDASAAGKLVGQTAQLDFREPPATLSAEQTASKIPEIYFFKSTGLTGSDLKKSQVVYGSGGTDAGPQVQIDFSPEGAKKFATITKRNVGRPLAIFLDDQPVSAPVVNQEILGGTAVISGSFTVDEAKQLSIQLNAGALPVPIKIVEQRVVGASLGQESIDKSIVAGIIGLITVMGFMVFYYGRLGLIADLVLIIYSLFVLAIFKTGLFLIPPVTLTLAGIAGFILSIGMAVDANILIFERIKEERKWGKSEKQALDLGFRRAWSSIRDSNLSSLITAAILYYIGTGPVKGFAVTLAIGVLVSMFTAITVTKTILRLVIRDKR